MLTDFTLFPLQKAITETRLRVPQLQVNSISGTHSHPIESITVGTEQYVVWLNLLPSSAHYSLSVSTMKTSNTEHFHSYSGSPEMG